MKVTKNIDIYLTNKRPVKVIDVVQGDTGIQLVFTLKDFTIPGGSSATLYVQKPSGKFVYQNDNITVAENAITIDLENQALTEYGEIPYQVSIENGSDTVTTFTGMMIVQPSLKDSGATESKTVVRAFDELTVEKLAEFQERAETAANGVIATIPEDYTEMTAKVNESANAIKGNLSGAVVRADDVSPVEHLPKVKIVCPEDVDPSTVKVTRCGKNLINSANFATYHAGRFSNIALLESTENGKSITIKGNDGASGNANSSGWLILNYGEAFNLREGDKVTISADVTLVSAGIYGNSIKFAIMNNTTGGTYASPKFTIGEKARYTTTREAQADGAHRFIIMVNANTITLENIMVSVNGEDIYEDYINGTEYTPNADGTINGLTSVSPTMTLLTDTEGVTIECEYNKDTNKVISKLVNAISAMGGEVTI